MREKLGRLSGAVLVLFTCVAFVCAVPWDQCFAAWATWTQWNTNGFGNTNNYSVFELEVYDGTLYAGTHNITQGCEIWRYDGPTSSDWTELTDGGFSDSQNQIAYSMEVYGGDLYIGTRNNSANGLEIWRYDGATFTFLTDAAGLGDSDLKIPCSMTTYDGDLILGAGNSWTNNKAKVFGFDGTAWAQINTDSFGDSQNRQVRALAVFGGDLYAGAYNTQSGGQAWRYDGPTPADWTRVVAAGFGVGNDNQDVRSLFVYDEKLYGGTANTTDGSQVWESADGNSWLQNNPDIGVDMYYFDATRCMDEYHNNLYVGTGNALGAGGNNPGAQVWEYDASFSTWTQVNTNGFDEQTNMAAQDLVNWNGYLWAGVSNSWGRGGMVWRGGDGVLDVTPTSTPASTPTVTPTPTPEVIGHVFEGVPPYGAQPGIGDVMVGLYDVTTETFVDYTVSSAGTGYYSFSLAPDVYIVCVGTGTYQTSLTGLVSTNPRPPAFDLPPPPIPVWAGGPEGVGLSFFDPPFDLGFLSPTPTSTPTQTPTSTPTNTPTQTSTATPSPTMTPTSSPSNTPTQTSTATPSPTMSPTATPSSTPSGTPTASPSSTPTNTPTQTSTATPSPTMTPTSSPSNTPTQTSTATPSPTMSPTATPSSTPSGTPTASPSGTPTGTPTNTPTNTATCTPTSTPTETPTPTPEVIGRIFSGIPPYAAQPGIGDVMVGLYDVTTETFVDYTVSSAGTGYYSFSLAPDVYIVCVGTGTYQTSLTGLVSTNPRPPAFDLPPPPIPVWAGGPEGVGLGFFDPPFDLGFLIPTPTPTNTPTVTNTPTGTSTHTPTNTPTNTPTRTSTATPSPTMSPTATPSSTPSGTPTASPSGTPTGTPTNTPTNTATCTPTSTPTVTPTPTPEVIGRIFSGIPPYAAQPGIGDVMVGLYDVTTETFVDYTVSSAGTGYYSFSLAPDVYIVCVGTGTYQTSLTGLVSTNPRPPAFDLPPPPIPVWAGGPEGVGLGFFDPPFDLGFLIPTPTPTNTPTVTNTPTGTSTHTPTNTPTNTPTATNTATSTATNTATPTITNTPLPVVPLALMKDQGGDYNIYGYEVPMAGDYTYWDALARNPSAHARDFWMIPYGNNTLAMTEVNADDAAEQELALVKAEQGGIDYNLYLYNSPGPDDYTYWDAEARNPSPLARDFWMIDPRNDISLIADGGSHLVTMKATGTDYNLYLYNSPYPGDYTYWDAEARNPSPLARDLWFVPGGNDAVAMCGVDTVGDGDSDSLLVVRNQSGTYGAYLWNMPAAGDYTYWDSLARNPSPLARDFWAIPPRDDIEYMSGIGSESVPDNLGVLENLGGDYNFYLWNMPVAGDWVYWDSAARNPSPLARDFWMIPSGNNMLGMAAPN